jgi:glycosyltransferase involved in cell wall biosynthesis
MRIAQIAPLHEAVPPKLYGGTERVISYLTEELVAQGHEVTLFASGDSITSARLEPIWPQALRLSPALSDTTVPHVLLMETARRQADRFDVMHFHVDYWPFSLFSRQRTPFVTTLHGRLDVPELKAVFNAFPHVPIVSISDAQRRPLPQARYVATVYRGSVPEVIEDGVTGFIVEDEPEAITAVGRVPALSRAAVRTRFEARFTAQRMAQDYLRVYRSLAGEDRTVLRATG